MPHHRPSHLPLVLLSPCLSPAPLVPGKGKGAVAAGVTAGESLGGLQNACSPPCAPQGAPSPVGLCQDLPWSFTLVRYRKATGYKKSTTKRFPLLYTYKQVSSEIVKLKGLCCCCLSQNRFCPRPAWEVISDAGEMNCCCSLGLVLTTSPRHCLFVYSHHSSLVLLALPPQLCGQIRGGCEV